MNTKKALAYASMLSIIGGHEHHDSIEISDEVNESRECQHSKCNKTHSHNNSCCSPECFKAMKKERSN